jgi:hypothetical protein
MAAKLRIYQAGVQNLAKGITKLRIYQAGVQILWVDAPYWGFDVEAVSSIEFEVTVGNPSMIVFPHVPSLGMKESFEWLTDIITSKDGSEQRISVRKTPRQFLDIKVFLKNEQEQSDLNALLFYNQKSIWGVPCWHEYTKVASLISSGDISVYFDTSYADYRDNSLALLWQSEDSFEVLNIETVESDHLILSSNVISTWSGTKWIMPLRVGYIQNSSKITSKAGGEAEFEAVFMIWDNKLLTGYVPERTYNESTVLLDASIEDGGQVLEIDSDVVITDYGYGMFDVFSDSDFNKYVRSHVFRNNNKEDCWNFKLFLYSLYGRRNAIYMPSYMADMVLKETMSSSAVTFVIDGTKLTTYMEVNTLRTHVAFMFPNGDTYLREITGFEASGNETIVTINAPLGIQINVGDCELCFLDKYRLTEDRLEIEYEEPFSNICRTNFTRVVE